MQTLIFSHVVARLFLVSFACGLHIAGRANNCKVMVKEKKAAPRVPHTATLAQSIQFIAPLVDTERVYENSQSRENQTQGTPYFCLSRGNVLSCKVLLNQAVTGKGTHAF